jgi:transposase
LDSIVTPGRKKRRPNFSPEFRKALAQRACEPGVSVSRLAQENDVNVNMVFKWRRYLLAGKFDNAVRQQAMLPVVIADAPETTGSSTKLKQPAASAAAMDSGLPQQGIIEIRIADATVRFDGQADLARLRAVVRMLRP